MAEAVGTRFLGGGGSKVEPEVFGSSFSSSLQKFGEGIDSISHDLSHTFFPYSGDFLWHMVVSFIFDGFFELKTEIETVRYGKRKKKLGRFAT